jgi:ubiquinone/menaquinone biosynthesis C-methylase UbiE
MFGPSYRYARALLQAATARSALKILEIGCGCGEDSIILSGENNEVCAIDSDEQRVAAARQSIRTAGKAAQISVYQMDAGSLEFADNSFDLIYANSFLLWVDREAVLNECRRVVRPGGTMLFVHESMKGNPISNVYRLAGFRKKRELLVDRPRPKELVGLGVQCSNFRAQYFYLFSPLLYPLIQRFPAAWPLQRLCFIFQKIDAYLLSRLPWLDRFAWIGVLQYTK